MGSHFQESGDSALMRVVSGGAVWVLLLPFFLVFLGDLQVPVGDSTVTVPLAALLIMVVLPFRLMNGQLLLTQPVLLLLGVLIFGAVGMAINPAANLARASAGALPVLFSALLLLAYSCNSVTYERAVRFMLVGGTVLATQVIFLYFFCAITAPGDYYDQKLLIETPLGRSNYLSAFLVFLVALSWPRNKIISSYFVLSVFCTMSRGGLLMLFLLPLAIILPRRALWVLGIGVLVLFGSALLVIHVGGVEVLMGLVDFSDDRFDSMVNRLLLWSFGTELWSSHLLFGISPNGFRTFVEQTDGVEDVWGVHNAILLLLLNYGVGGLLCYGAYLLFIYKTIVAAEKINKEFRVVRSVFIVLLVFGLFEPLVGSAAFEVLLALIFVLARSVRSCGVVSVAIPLTHGPAPLKV